MRKTLIALLLCLLFSNIFAQQSKHKVSAYLSASFSKTVYDITPGNNPWGMGLGLQTFLNNSSKFKLTMEATGDVYLEDDKVLVFQNGDVIKDIGGVVNVLAGASFHPDKTVYLSLLAGPSFINNKTLFGIKSSIGFYLSEKQRWVFKFYYTNIFNRAEEFSRKDFGTVGISIGCRLF